MCTDITLTSPLQTTGGKHHHWYKWFKISESNAIKPAPVPRQQQQQQKSIINLEWLFSAVCN